MDDTVMGLMYIAESFSDTPATISNLNPVKNAAADLFYITFDTNLQDFDVLNRNKRMYDGSNIEECIHSEKIQSQLATNGWFGEWDHPTPEIAGEKLSPERIQNVPPLKRCFKIMRPRFHSNILSATIQSATNDIGESFAKETLAGWIPQFSARAIATMVYRNGKPYVIVKRLITYDSVLYPSHAIAAATSKPVLTAKSFTESVSDTINTVTESVTDFVNGMVVSLKDILADVGHRDVNTQLILESFELDESALIGFNDAHNKVIIKDDNNTIYANINPETVKLVNEFYRSF